MKRLIMAVLFICIGCTSQIPQSFPADELQQKIRSGEIVTVGKVVKVVTQQGEHIEMAVVKMTESHLQGDEVSVLISDVVALETNEFSSGKTALLAGGLITLYSVLAAIATAVTIGL